MKKFTVPLMLAAVAAFSVMLMGQTSAPAPEVVPSAMAVVNLVYIFDHIDERTSGQSEFEKMATNFSNEKTKREAELDKLSKDLANPNLFKPGSPQFLQMQDEALKKAADLKAFIEYVQMKLAIEQRNKTAELYKHINEAIEAFSKANGIALVFVTDDGNFDDAKNVQEILLRANSRKIIYAYPRYDITKKIVEKMNTDFMLGKK